MAATATRPEVVGLLSVAAHHERAIRSLEHVHWNDPDHQREVLEKHRRKLMRLLRRAERLAGVGEGMPRDTLSIFTIGFDTSES